MQIVIDIPDEIYKKYIDEFTGTTDVLHTVRHGTPLPKGHGRLIDADELEECAELMNTINGESKYAVRCDDIRSMATIIESDKGSEDNACLDEGNTR